MNCACVLVMGKGERMKGKLWLFVPTLHELALPLPESIHPLPGSTFRSIFVSFIPCPNQQSKSSPWWAACTGNQVHAERSFITSCRAALELDKAVSVDVLDFAKEPLALYNPDTAHEGPAFAALRTRVENADVILLGTPDYHGSISGAIKNFLEHVWREFAGKLFVTIVASHEKGLTVTDQLRTVARQCYAWTLPYGVSFTEGHDAKGGEIVSDAFKQRLEMLVRDTRICGLQLLSQQPPRGSPRRRPVLPRALARINNSRSIKAGASQLFGKSGVDRPVRSGVIPVGRVAGFATCGASAASSRVKMPAPCRQECRRHGRQECLRYASERQQLWIRDPWQKTEPRSIKAAWQS